MNNEAKKWLSIISIAIVVSVILMLLLSGFDLSSIEIHRGFKIKIPMY